MSTTDVTQPPAPPAAPPSGGGGGGGGPEPMSIVQVTRNVPPKKVMVSNGVVVNVGGKSYHAGDTALMAGPEADALALSGQVVIVEHNAADEWNSREGETHRKAALAHIDKTGNPDGSDERTHDHGFGRYEHADGERAIPVDLTGHRQQLAREHLFDANKPDTMSDDQAGLAPPDKTGGKE